MRKTKKKPWEGQELCSAKRKKKEKKKKNEKKIEEGETAEILRGVWW